MNFRGFMHATRNEHGLEEVEIELERSWWQRITGKPETLTFERWPTGWRNKATGEYATLEERCTITQGLKACL